MVDYLQHSKIFVDVFLTHFIHFCTVRIHFCTMADMFRIHERKKSAIMKIFPKERRGRLDAIKRQKK